MPRVHYHLSRYISHRTAGLAAMDALRGAGVELSDDPARADVLILHDDPLNLPPLIRAHGKGKHVIAYCVWEADILPRAYQESLRGVDRVWTCTPFSARPFLDALDCPVDVVPHVVAPPAPTPEDMEAMRQAIGFRDECCYLYTVADSVNPRKNLKTLLRAFATTFRSPTDVRLVVKQYRHPWDLGSLDNVISLNEELPPGRMAALHRVCHAYVSAHHAEAWGLSLTDAMAAGNPVMATGWSGNMFYMDQTNSLPVRYSLTKVSREMCDLVPLFTPDMTWADPDPGHLAYLMGKAARGKCDPALGRNAARAMQAFGPREVGALMRGMLESVLI